MKFLYTEYVEQVGDSESQLEGLTKLFSYLLMKTSGDVEEALKWIEYLNEAQNILGDMTMQEFVEELKKLGLIDQEGDVGELVLTGKGRQRIRSDALEEIFSALRKGGVGEHDTPFVGKGSEISGDSRPFTFGDHPTFIEHSKTISNALRRQPDLDNFELREEDISVYENESQTGVSTVLMIDISHSMILYGEDRITPAKQVAIALAELITTKYPSDSLEVLLFGDDVKYVDKADIPFVSVGPYHTNTRAGLQAARSLLRKKKGNNRQIFMITDGKPSAMFEDSGRLYKNSLGLDPRIVNRTLDEGVACRREKITISTFMVAQDPYLVQFVEDLTKSNKGRAYYTGLGDLGEMVFVDYVKNRRKQYKGGRAV